MTTQAVLLPQAAPITAYPSSSDFFNFPPGALQQRYPSNGSVASLVSTGGFYDFPPGPIQHRSPSSASVASLASQNSGYYNFPAGAIQHRSPSSASVASLGVASLASHSAYYNFPPEPIANQSPSSLSVASLASHSAYYNFPPQAIAGVPRVNSGRVNTQNPFGSRSKVASMVSIAESGGSEDVIIDADFSPKAVACYATPESSPQGVSAANKPRPVALV
jgi:hypothetical protein